MLDIFWKRTRKKKNVGRKKKYLRELQVLLKLMLKSQPFNEITQLIWECSFFAVSSAVSHDHSKHAVLIAFLNANTNVSSGDKGTCIHLQSYFESSGEYEPSLFDNVIKLLLHIQLSHDMKFPTMWYVRPAKAQTSLGIRAVWSEPFLVAWIFYEL